MENAERVDLAMSFIRSEMGEEVHESEDKNRETLREQDRFLPIANVARIMKKGIPKTGKVLIYVFCGGIKWPSNKEANKRFKFMPFRGSLDKGSFISFKYLSL